MGADNANVFCFCCCVDPGEKKASGSSGKWSKMVSEVKSIQFLLPARVSDKYPNQKSGSLGRPGRPGAGLKKESFPFHPVSHLIVEKL